MIFDHVFQAGWGATLEVMWDEEQACYRWGDERRAVEMGLGRRAPVPYPRCRTRAESRYGTTHYFVSCLFCDYTSVSYAMMHVARRARRRHMESERHQRLAKGRD